MKSIVFSWAMVFVFGLATAQKVAQRPFKIIPENIPNEGILFVDHEKNGRSGHGGHAVTECSNGDIIAFYMNTWGEEQRGHGSGGWSSYKRSKDGGKTWGEPVDLKYSWDMWNKWDKEVHSAMVFGATTAPDGTIIATVVRFADASWHKRLPPVYLLSHDNGYTWSEPMEFDKNATVYDIAMTFNTNFVRNNEVFIVFFGGPENPSVGPYSLYVSKDNGKTFSRCSILPFDHRNYYCAASALDNGDIIVYSYPYPTDGRFANPSKDTDEKNIPYVISKDGGLTWSEVKTTYFAKAVRNPQMSGKVGDYYFMQGRSGSYGENPNNFVLYSSKDGINWDEGVYLMTHQSSPHSGNGGDCYSGNAVIGNYNPSSPKRLLIQADLSYNGAKVNIYHWWVEVPGQKRKN
jgi:Neuraminidase (sialidase)